VIAAGVFFDVIVYTIFLKRRTPYSILIGGLAGGMPALAGRVLAVGKVDGIGLLLALGVLLWIPTHILTFSIKHREDYARANLPTFPSVYGEGVTRKIVAVSTILAVLVLFIDGLWIGLSLPILLGMGLSGGLLSGIVFWSLWKPCSSLNKVLYRGASIYMLASMLLVIMGGF
jgi:protoheme IX farnesyltransferase